MLYTTLYLVSIVLANLFVARFGPSVIILGAFLFIGLDLTARDALHEEWKNSNLKLKMFLLVLSGSLLSWFLNRSAGSIALASFIAFAGANIVDTLVYSFLQKKTRFVKINGSNIASALVDSILFPTIAFGVFVPSLILGQFVAKVLGGFLWSLVLAKRKKK